MVIFLLQSNLNSEKSSLGFNLTWKPVTINVQAFTHPSVLQMVLTFKFCWFRVIRELEAQLEYEREKREKLEAQMDKLRAQIHTLTLQLEDERSRHVTAVSIFA